MSQTVSAAAIASMVFSGSISLLLPIGLFALVRKRLKAGFFPLIVGMGTFVVFALFLEGTLHKILLGGAATGPFLTSNWFIYALYGGLMAGLFEETGRLCAMFFILRRKHNQMGDALAYGIGHGGIEAVILCSFMMLYRIIMAITVNSGGMVGMMSQAPGQAFAMESIAASLNETPAALFLVSGVERVFAIFAHIAMSILVWMAVSGRGPFTLYFLSILCHMLISFPACLYQYGILGVLPTEISLAVLVAALCIFTYHLYRKCAQTYTPLLNYNPTDFGL